MNAMVKKQSKCAGYIIAIIVNLILIYVFSNLVRWGVPFITSRLDEVLWAFYLSIGATIAVNALYIIYDAGWFRHLTQVMLAVFGFNSVYQLYTVFPFDLKNAFFEQALLLAFILAMVGTAIALVVELTKLIRGRN